MTKICTHAEVEYHEETKLNDDKINRILQKWMIEIHVSQMKAPKITADIIGYLLTNMDQQGVLLQSIKAISKNSGKKENEVKKVLGHLESEKLIYKKYGIVGIRNFNEAIEENKIE